MNKKIPMILRLTIAVLFVFAYLFGCVSQPASKKKEEMPPVAKRITAITVEEDLDGVYVRIRGSESLAYTSVKQPSPLGVILYFPETVLEDTVSVVEPASDLIGTIQASNVEADTPASRIEIALKQDLPYNVDQDGSDIKVSFKKPVATRKPVSTLTAEADKAEPVEEESVKEETLKPLSTSTLTATTEAKKPATTFESVSYETLDDGVTISLNADGEIQNYNAFTIKNPSRIVLDAYNLKSPKGKEKSVAVNTKWVKRIRYYGYPDRFRMVVDTTQPYLKHYRAVPFENGIQIKVGGEKTLQAEVKKAEIEPVKRPPAAPSAGTAWVNRIDFSSETEGKSAILVQTTRPVEYQLQKVADKQLQLKLFNTQLPEYRQRPLITTRFESAVDRITPYHTKSLKDTALFSIELRQEVPFRVTQDENLITINFEASTIPPRAFEEAKLPAWKKALTQAAEEMPLQQQEAEAETATAEGVVGTKRTKFTGEKIALDFYETDIKNVFRILREVSGKNFAIDKDVSGKVTLSLEKPVPWDQILDLVLRMNQLGTVAEGDIIRVATLATINKELEQKRLEAAAEAEAKKEKKALEPLVTEYISINYANAAADVMPHIVLTPDRGSVTVDERNNQIIITDTADMVKQARETIRQIDQVTPQVLIEARIVEATTEFVREFGTQWEVNGTTFTRELENGIIPEGKLDYNIQAINPPTNAPRGILGIDFTKLTGSPFEIIEAQLMAAETNSEVNIVSSPSILTLDNKTAKIKQGTQVPIAKLDDSGNTVIEYRDVDLELEVTPHVTRDQRISMEIKVTNNELGTRILGELSFTTKEANTELIVNDGDTVVIGGIRKNTTKNNEDGIPGLMKIPMVSWLFKTELTDNKKEELLIFITPKIIILEQKG